MPEVITPPTPDSDKPKPLGSMVMGPNAPASLQRWPEPPKLLGGLTMAELRFWSDEMPPAEPPLIPTVRSSTMG